MRWLLDEMLPPATARRLTEMGHDALAVRDADLLGAPDREIYAAAVETDRTMVTENVADFAGILAARIAAQEPCVPVVFVRRTSLARHRGLAEHLARNLDAWAQQNPRPYVGPHWL